MISLRLSPRRNRWQASRTAKFRTLSPWFWSQTLLGAADTLIDLVSREKLRHIFLLGGCDGARGERHYFTDFATSVPDDCLILTLACGKYRFNKLEFGDIEGLPVW
ncbi:hydroxylamine reductase [Escherichia coli]|uniref:Hydroxylamine reductase n=1 Tax=Escherichia coli TaxID=562 RepID=A0A377E648_ECOLX|nr:hydroxylamine reductase [Escherichia coli]